MVTATPETELRSGTDSQSQISEALARHHRLLYYAVNRYIRARQDLKDDILAVGRAALAEAIRTYRAEMGFAFSTYALHQMQWGVCGFLSKFTHGDQVTNSLDEALGKDEEGDFTLAHVADATNAAREQAAGIADENVLRRIHDLRAAIATCTTLTVGEREILEAFLLSGNCGMVAARLGVTSARVSQALASAAPKLRKHLHAIPVHS